MDTKNRVKAITGFAITAITLTLVFAIIIPVAVGRQAANEIDAGDTVFIGEQGLKFDTNNNGVYGDAGDPDFKLEGAKDTVTEGVSSITVNAKGWTVPSVTEGKYKCVGGGAKYNGKFIYIAEPEITGDVILNSGKQDSVVGKSVPVSSEIVFKIEPNFGGKIPSAKVDIKLYDPDDTEVQSIDGVSLSDIPAISTTFFVTDLTPIWTTTAPPYPDAIDLEDMDTGEYRVVIKTDKESCNLLDVSSPEYEFRLCSEELSIEAVEEEVVKGEDIVIKIRGNPRAYYYLTVTGVDTDEPPEIKMAGDVKKLSGEEVISKDAPNLAAWIKTGSDGIADVKISTEYADERTYTIHVYDTPMTEDNKELTEEIEFVKDSEIVDSKDDDDVDVEVTEIEVTFDTPSTAVIGEVVIIKGAISAGDKVYIVIEDADKVFKEAVDENNEFEVKWKTEGLVPGTYTIDVFIDPKFVTKDNWDKVKTYEGKDEDGKTSIRLVGGALKATQPRKVIAEGDDYTIEGTATGVNNVDIILIGPKGYARGAAKPSIENGLKVIASSVDKNDEFNEDITMTGGLDTGMWLALVLSPGRDGEYAGFTESVGAGEIEAEMFGDIRGKDQAQILSIIQDCTIDRAGSDDLLVLLTFELEPAYVRFNQVETVTVGEPLYVSGTTNRESDTLITISTFAGPMDLPVGIAEVDWPTPEEGVFEATIDTTGVKPGIYTLEADDGDGHTAKATVKILPAITPTSIRLYKKWNFISVPKKLAEGHNTFEQVFGSVDTAGHSIFCYNTTEGWRAVSASEEVKPLRGYWIYSAEDTIVNLTYDTYPLRTPPTRQLYQGWNAIGFSDTTPAAANSALTSIERSWAYLIAFDAAKQGYESVIINDDETGGSHDEDNLMYPMKGYWIYVTEDSELVGISV